MERQYIQTVRRVTNELHGMEHSIDDAMRDCASFIVTMIDSARDLKLSTTVGNEAYVGATTALERLASSRSAVAELHAHLLTLHGDLSADKVTAHGDLWKIAEKPKASSRNAASAVTVVPIPKAA